MNSLSRKDETVTLCAWCPKWVTTRINQDKSTQTTDVPRKTTEEILLQSGILVSHGICEKHKEKIDATN